MKFLRPKKERDDSASEAANKLLNNRRAVFFILVQVTVALKVYSPPPDGVSSVWKIKVRGRKRILTMCLGRDAGAL